MFRPAVGVTSLDDIEVDVEHPAATAISASVGRCLIDGGLEETAGSE
jgi:hypothetical protein